MGFADSIVQALQHIPKHTPIQFLDSFVIEELVEEHVLSHLQDQKLENDHMALIALFLYRFLDDGMVAVSVRDSPSEAERFALLLAISVVLDLHIILERNPKLKDLATHYVWPQVLLSHPNQSIWDKSPQRQESLNRRTGKLNRECEGPYELFFRKSIWVPHLFPKLMQVIAKCPSQCDSWRFMKLPEGENFNCKPDTIGWERYWQSDREFLILHILQSAAILQRATAFKTNSPWKSRFSPFCDAQFVSTFEEVLTSSDMFNFQYVLWDNVQNQHIHLGFVEFVILKCILQIPKWRNIITTQDLTQALKDQISARPRVESPIWGSSRTVIANEFVPNFVNGIFANPVPLIQPGIGVKEFHSTFGDELFWRTLAVHDTLKRKIKKSSSGHIFWTSNNVHDAWKKMMDELFIQNMLDEPLVVPSNTEKMIFLKTESVPPHHLEIYGQAFETMKHGMFFQFPIMSPYTENEVIMENLKSPTPIQSSLDAMCRVLQLVVIHKLWKEHHSILPIGMNLKTQDYCTRPFSHREKETVASISIFQNSETSIAKVFFPIDPKMGPLVSRTKMAPFAIYNGSKNKRRMQYLERLCASELVQSLAEHVDEDWISVLETCLGDPSTNRIASSPPVVNISDGCYSKSFFMFHAERWRIVTSCNSILDRLFLGLVECLSHIYCPKTCDSCNEKILFTTNISLQCSSSNTQG